MKKTVLGALIGAGLVIVAIGALDSRSEVFAQRMTETGQFGQLIAVPGPVSENGQLLTVIDTKLRAMSVYRIDQATGKIALCSVRNIHWDLQMMYMDNEGPLPHEIRSLLEQR